MVVSLPTIESSYSSHITKGIQGFTHAERPALVVASEILNATESYLWVRVFENQCEPPLTIGLALYSWLRSIIWRYNLHGSGGWLDHFLAV